MTEIYIDNNNCISEQTVFIVYLLGLFFFVLQSEKKIQIVSEKVADDLLETIIPHDRGIHRNHISFTLQFFRFVRIEIIPILLDSQPWQYDEFNDLKYEFNHS